MGFRQLIIALFSVVLVSIFIDASPAMEVNLGNIRVQTTSDGALYVDTANGRIYIPPEDDYYEEGDYYEGDYDDYDYGYESDDCQTGRTVIQRNVQRSDGRHHESYSSVYSTCR